MKCLMITFVIALVIIAENVIPLEAHGHHHGGGHFDVNKCCNVEKATNDNSDFATKMAGLAEQCKQELGSTGSPGKGPGKFICLHECIGNKTNIIDADKNLNEEQYRNFVNDMASQDFQKAASGAIVTKCIDRVKTPTSDSSEETSANGCAKASMIAIKCAFKEMVKSCPTELQDQSDRCLKMREIMNNDQKMSLEECS